MDSFANRLLDTDMYDWDVAFVVAPYIGQIHVFTPRENSVGKPAGHLFTQQEGSWKVE